MYNLLIVDYYFAVIEGIRTILTKEKFDFNYFTATNHSEALKIITHSSIDCIILDIALPKDEGLKPFEFEGIDFISEVRTLNSDIKIIVITDSGRTGLLKKISSMGVDGLIFKNQMASDLIVATQLVLIGKKYFQHFLLNGEDEEQSKSKLLEISTVEEQILNLLADGKRVKQISLLINKSERTIERGLSDLRIAFEAESNPELIRKAIRLGFLE